MRGRGTQKFFSLTVFEWHILLYHSMTALLLTRPIFHASFDRQAEWRKCCALAMGFEWVDPIEGDDDDDDVVVNNNEADDQLTLDQSNPVHQVINLLEEYHDDDDDDEEDEKEGEFSFDHTQQQNPNIHSVSRDHWTENALRIQADLQRMTLWIRTKQYDFVSVDMPDGEASLIQSTVTSFTATTANELETLRNMISSSSNLASHRAGVVQILLSQLKEQVAEPFGRLQQQRTRIAVQLWQSPLQCKLYIPKPKKQRSEAESRMIQLLDEQDNDLQQQKQLEQRFLPRRPSPPEDYDFLATYKATEPHLQGGTMPRRPEFLTRLARKKRRFEAPTNDAVTLPEQQISSNQTIPFTAQPLSYQQQQPRFEEENRQQLQEDLEQEAALLMVAVHNDLDSVQKTEQRMVEITTLISQFSNLVSEQQEDIWQIHEAARETKDNMESGQENLVNATEKTKRSKHYMATSIFAMAIVLLFFHTIRS